MKFKKPLHVFIMLLAILFVFSTTANAFGGVPVRVRITIDEETQNVQTSYIGQITVAELLTREGIELGPLDDVQPDLNTVLERNAHIVITRAFGVYVSIDGGEPFAHVTRPNINISRFASDFRLHMGRDFVFDPDLWPVAVTPEMLIELRSRTSAVYEEFENIPYYVYYYENDQMLYGEHAIYAYGHSGVLQTLHRVERIAGEENSRHTETNIVAQPVNKIIHVGTFIPEPEPVFVLADNQRIASCGTVFSYRRHILVETTAYTASFECTGRHPGDPWFGVTASGMLAQIGVVAVDTRYIPFNTRMYIEGYGFAIAGDRGGAIRGYKIDLFKNSRAEAFQWGRRHNVRVWILDDYSEFPLEIIPR